jgi:PEP-CTERM motif
MNMTMKKSAMFLLLAMAAIVPAQAAVITLSPSTPTPGAGSNFSVQVLVTNVFTAPHVGDELFGFGFDVASSPGGRITFLSFTAGPLFDALSLAGTDVSGIVQVPALSLTAPLAEPLLLGTLNFLAVSAGAVTLNITADYLNNLNEGLQYLGASDDLAASVTLNVGGAAIPEPSTALLAALGLAIVAVYFQRR